MEVNPCRHKWVTVVSANNSFRSTVDNVDWCANCGRVTVERTIGTKTITEEYEIGGTKPTASSQ